MSVFRIFYRPGEESNAAEDVEAVEFLVQEPWIVFLDPSGACLSVRSDRVERVQRLPGPTSGATWQPRPARPSSDPPIPDDLDTGAA